MAIGWLTALKTIPWADVISTAPMVVDGAKKLWSSVAKKSAAPELPHVGLPSASPPEAITALEARVAALEATARDSHSQMVASSELIQALAEQNTQLIKRLETNRVRFAWLTAAVGATAIVAIGALVLAMVRHGS